MRIFAINLARSKDRRQLITSNLERLGLQFEFFTGIDPSLGEHVGISRYLETAARRNLGRPLTPGEVGCFTSHYLLWQRCLEANEPFVIIEDDVLVDDSFVRALEAASELTATCPLLRLGVTYEGPNSTEVSSILHGFEVVLLAPRTYGTQCYVLSGAGAKALLDRAGVWWMPVDDYLDCFPIHGVRSYGLRPYPVRLADQDAYPSVIGEERYGQLPQDASLWTLEARVKKFLAERGCNGDEF
jgi:glycosyl transferase family 25